MIKRMWLVIALLGMFSALPARSDIPTDIVDQYWYRNPESGWHNPINKINAATPVWNPNGMGNETLWVDNVLIIPDQVTNIWVEIKFMTMQTQVHPITVQDPNGIVYTPWKTWLGVEDKGSTSSQFTTSKFQLPWQPDWVYIQFDSTVYYNPFESPIEVLEIATQCVPEPMSIMSLMFGIIGLGSVAGFKKLRKS